MEDAVRLGRVIGILDEVKESLTSPHEGASQPWLLRQAEKITQAQNLLVGGDEPSPKMN